MSKNPYRRRLETYLKDKRERGELLPSLSGRVNYSAIAIEANIPYNRFKGGSELRLLVEDSLKKLGVSNDALRTQPLRTSKSEVHAPSLTYGALKTSGLLQLRDNYAERTVASYLSHLNAFMRYFERTDRSSTVEDFGVNFEDRLNTFMKATGSPNATASALRAWSRIHVELHQSTSLPASFSAALAMLMMKSGRTQADIARAAGMKRASVLSGWMLGNRRPTDPEQVVKLEVALDVVPGTLSSKLSFCPVRRATIIPKAWWPETWQKYYGPYGRQRNKVIDLIPKHLLSGPLEALKPAFDDALRKVIEGVGEPRFRQKIRKLMKSRYRLALKKWPAQLRGEFLALTEYKTAPSGLGNKERRGEWEEETVGIRQHSLESFFGFLCLPVDQSDPELRGMGLPLDDLTLAWLAVYDVVERFLDFRCLRSGDYNSEAVSFIKNWAALLQPESGWLWLHPELLDRLPEQQRRKVEAAGGWENYCVSVLAEFKKSLVLLKRDGLINQTRDPMAPIAPILDHGKPLSLIDNALRQTRRELDASNWRDETIGPALAVQERDYVMISLLARLPLRSKQLRRLTYKKDGSGNLQNHPRDGWRLLLPHKDFKNYRSRKIFGTPGREGVITLKFNDFELLKQLIPILEFYLTHVFPIIAGEGGFLFPTRDGGPLSRNHFYSRVTTWTRKYLSQDSTRPTAIKGVFQFGPHAFRDILATHIIKTTGNISLAANILLDSEEIVRKHYARFFPEDRLKLAMAKLTAVFRTDEDEED